MNSRNIVHYWTLLEGIHSRMTIDSENIKLADSPYSGPKRSNF